MIITRTPFRISFFGGGTDYPDWYTNHGGSVLATTIDKYCYISCRRLPPFFEHKHRIVYSRIENVASPRDIEHPAVRAVLTWANVVDGIEIHHDGDLPARSGLGSSSSFTVGLIHALYALRGQMASKEMLAQQAIEIEQNVIGENVGSQDQVSASYGGFNRIDFSRSGSIDVSPMVLHPERQRDLQSHLMLCFTGISRIASEVAKSKIANLNKRQDELKRMHRMVDEATNILQGSGPIDEFGKLLDESWQYKRQLSDRVSTPDIDDLYEAARSAGATGGKLLGAGGGGFMLLFARPERQEAVRNRLNRLVHVPFQFETAGSRVVLYQPHGFE
ncbi:D,D-heptose 7-phosphate kinase [Rhodopseudomonas palustris]|uniref:GHMP family kinase ATP-binding protein n=1 Tax=Rhodopseudomonas palustris TaxID=1076 RepID=UPI000D1A5B8A|nr:kinase [Rhodopseudomonas palustris]AVT78116.1 D,D-heptose 7-phosphate kinase [Rhodopseudomonas palustris]